jgi:hypothetical protein
VELTEDKLFVEPTKVVGDWLWYSGRIGNKLELALSCLGEFVAERANGRMVSIGGEAEPTALCGSLPYTIIATGASWSLAPSFFRLEEYGAVFYVVVGFTVMVHVVRRLECVWASAVTAVLAWRIPSLMILV